jgi:PHD/YefM family antitoxin component YafN of YafNO toxin-antitoxin module
MLFFQVLLSRDEFATLSMLLADYESADISVDLFAAGLLNLIADAEKVRHLYC